MIAIALACEPKLLIADDDNRPRRDIQAQILDLIDSFATVSRWLCSSSPTNGSDSGRTDRVMSCTPARSSRARRPAACSPRCATPTPRRSSTRSPRWTGREPTALQHPRHPPDLAVNSSVPLRAQVPQRHRALRQKSRLSSTKRPRSRLLQSCRQRHRAPPRAARRRPTVAQALALQRVNELASRKVIVEVDQLVKEFPVTAGAVCSARSGA